MDGGDWAMILVSIFTVIGSILGSQKVAEHQDRRNAAAHLLAKIREDINQYQQWFEECLVALCEWERLDKQIAKHGKAFDANGNEDSWENYEKRIGEATNHIDRIHGTFYMNVFLVSFTIGDDISAKLQNDLTTLQTFVVEQFKQYRFRRHEVESVYGGLQEKSEAMIREIEKEMKVVMGKVKEFNLS